MKKEIDVTLNKKVFVELYWENEEYHVAAYFRYTHKFEIGNFKTLEAAKSIYQIITEQKKLNT